MKMAGEVVCMGGRAGRKVCGFTSQSYFVGWQWG